MSPGAGAGGNEGGIAGMTQPRHGRAGLGNTETGSSPTLEVVNQPTRSGSLDQVPVKLHFQLEGHLETVMAVLCLVCARY